MIADDVCSLPAVSTNHIFWATKTTKNPKTSEKKTKKNKGFWGMSGPRTLFRGIVFFGFFGFPLVFLVFGSGGFYRLLGPPKTQKGRKQKKGLSGMCECVGQELCSEALFFVVFWFFSSFGCLFFSCALCRLAVTDAFHTSTFHAHEIPCLPVAGLCCGSTPRDAWHRAQICIPEPNAFTDPKPMATSLHAIQKNSSYASMSWRLHSCSSEFPGNVWPHCGSVRLCGICGCTCETHPRSFAEWARRFFSKTGGVAHSFENGKRHRGPGHLHGLLEGPWRLALRPFCQHRFHSQCAPWQPTPYDFVDLWQTASRQCGWLWWSFACLCGHRCMFFDPSHISWFLACLVVE